VAAFYVLNYCRVHCRFSQRRNVGLMQLLPEKVSNIIKS
jgi:hypothetical protein